MDDSERNLGLHEGTRNAEMQEAAQLSTQEFYVKVFNDGVTESTT